MMSTRFTVATLMVVLSTLASSGHAADENSQQQQPHGNIRKMSWISASESVKTDGAWETAQAKQAQVDFAPPCLPDPEDDPCVEGCGHGMIPNPFNPNEEEALEQPRFAGCSNYSCICADSGCLKSWTKECIKFYMQCQSETQVCGSLDDAPAFIQDTNIGSSCAMAPGSINTELCYNYPLTASPSATPSATPTATPSGSPTPSPSATPSASPSAPPTPSPSASPSDSPSASPTGFPTDAAVIETASPTAFPTAGASIESPTGDDDDDDDGPCTGKKGGKGGKGKGGKKGGHGDDDDDDDCAEGKKGGKGGKKGGYGDDDDSGGKGGKGGKKGGDDDDAGKGGKGGGKKTGYTGKGGKGGGSSYSDDYGGKKTGYTGKGGKGGGSSYSDDYGGKKTGYTGKGGKGGSSESSDDSEAAKGGYSGKKSGYGKGEGKGGSSSSSRDGKGEGKGGSSSSSRSSSSLDPLGECVVEGEMVDFMCTEETLNGCGEDINFRNCLCDVSTEGDSICFNNIVCPESFIECSSSHHCPDNWVCINLGQTATCNCPPPSETPVPFRDICVPVCGEFGIGVEGVEDVQCGPTLAGPAIPCPEDEVVATPEPTRPPRSSSAAAAAWEAWP